MENGIGQELVNSLPSNYLIHNLECITSLEHAFMAYAEIPSEEALIQIKYFPPAKFSSCSAETLALRSLHGQEGFP